MIFKDDAPYLKEWIEYHKIVGVQHFYLYNNNSTDEYLQILQPYIESGLVELIDWNFTYDEGNVTKWDQIQCNAYRDAHKRCVNKTKWLMVVDSDEFFVPVKHKNLRSLLKDYENDEKLVAIYAKWVFFGTSNVAKIPDNKLLIEVLLRNSGVPKFNALFKGISRPERVADYSNPHYIKGKPGYGTINIGWDILQVNHYWCRDEHYLYNEKIPRREGWGWSKEQVLLYADSGNLEKNQCSLPILRFVPKLRKKMRLHSSSH